MRLVREGHSTKRAAALEVAVPQDLRPAEDLEQLFLEAYHRLHRRLLDHAERFLSRDDAQDAVGDAIADLWRRWTVLAPEQRSDKYIFGVAQYCVFAKLKSNDPLVSLDDAGAELDQLAAQSAVDQDEADEREERARTLAEILDRALTVMPPGRRAVFLLIREESLSYKEAAEVLGLTVGGVNSHYHLAVKDLRKAFTRAGFRIANLKPARLPSPKGGTTHD